LRLNKQLFDLQYVTTIHPKQIPLELNKLGEKFGSATILLNDNRLVYYSDSLISSELKYEGKLHP